LRVIWHGYVLHEGITYKSCVPRTSQMTSRLLRHTAAAMRAHNVLCNSYNSITVEMNRCSFCRVRFALSYIVTHSKKMLQFLPYGRSIGSWICLTHKTYTCHTVRNITDTHNIVTCDMYTSCV
jgi:hypothetical protein